MAAVQSSITKQYNKQEAPQALCNRMLYASKAKWHKLFARQGDVPDADTCKILS